MTTAIKPGDLVWIVSDFYTRPNSSSVKGEILFKIDENWFRVYSSYWTSTGEKTDIQDLQSQMLRRIYEDESG